MKKPEKIWKKKEEENWLKTKINEIKKKEREKLENLFNSRRNLI